MVIIHFTGISIGHDSKALYSNILLLLHLPKHSQSTQHNVQPHLSHSLTRSKYIHTYFYNTTSTSDKKQNNFAHDDSLDYMKLSQTN